ncbi:MAG TPA: hypothetical protein VN444_01460 [Verrucomicrobiae bacterium]|nr:hypothetical protein [Verrucomicrobiae bacterium]
MYPNSSPFRPVARSIADACRRILAVNTPIEAGGFFLGGIKGGGVMGLRRLYRSIRLTVTACSSSSFGTSRYS